MRRLAYCTGLGLFLAGIVVSCAPYVGRDDAPRRETWQSRAIPEARGDIKEVDGKRVQIRYGKGAFARVTENFERWPTYGAADAQQYPVTSKASLPAVQGDPKKGRELFMDRGKGPCTGCHLIPGDDVWPAGNVGPDLSVIGDRRLPDQYLFDLIYDARVFFPHTSMPPWGTAGIFTPAEIAHIVAFLQTLKGNPPFVPPPEKDPLRNPFTRPTPSPYYGDNLDPTSNPAVVLAEGAVALWTKKGPAGKACADCHAGGAQQAMKGVATRYPKVVARYGRTMAIEDFLAVHAPETTGTALPAESAENLTMTMLIKMASNGMPVNVDITSPEAKAAYDRGRVLFYKRVGQRNHACADCHTSEKGGGKFLGGRFLGLASDGFTKHFPTFRTSSGEVWDIRKRFQWCMLPLGTNYLAADAPEYADLELYVTAYDNGKPLSVPGIRH
jgi:L-cysteine S-thiosulfotransferase